MIRNAVVGLIALALLGGAYYFAVKWQPESDEKTQTESSSIQLFNCEEDKLSELHIKNTEAEYTLRHTGEGDDTAWSIPEYGGIEFSQSKMKNTVLGLAGLYADKEITSDLSSLDEFGLSDEKTVFSLKMKDGTEKTFILGDKLVVDAKYYIMEKGGDKIYTISEYTAENVLKVPNDFRETNLGSIDTSDIKEISVSRGNEKVVEFYQTEKSDDKSSFQTSTVRMKYPYDENVSADRFEELVNAIPNAVEVIDFVSDNPADAQKYGIGSGYNVIIRDSAAAHTLRIGDLDSGGNAYAMYNDFGFIFTMKPDLLKLVKEIKPFDYVERFAHIYSIDSVSEITVSYGGKTHKLTVRKEGSGDNEKYVCAVDGKSAEEDAFKGMYQAIIGLTVTDTAKDGAQGAELCRIAFKMNDGSEKTAVYYDYDERSAVVVRPDGKRYLMLKKYVEEMTAKLDGFLKEPNKRPE